MTTSICILIIVLCLFNAYNAHQRIKINKKLHEANMLANRNYQVLLFRERVLAQYDEDIYNSMPTYEEMLQDKKDLTFANYVKIDKVINMN